jgi:hypothetical protein
MAVANTEMNELTNLIDTLVQQKTFSLEAVGLIKDLRDKAADLENKLKNSQVNGEHQRRDIQNNEAAIRRQNDELAKWAKREADIQAREAKMTELEKMVAVETTRATVYSVCMDKMLANRIVRESIQHSEPHTYIRPGDSYPQTTYQTRTQDTSREEG